LGVVHRIALRGDAPALADRFPSCGGDGRSIDIEVLLDVVRAHRAEVDLALTQQVQTNEPRRSVALVAVARWLAARDVDEFELLEIGSSAGLNQNFDRLGHEPPGVAIAARCVDRRGCDPFPLDPADDGDALRLLSFVWPDQSERFARLRAAIDVARRWPPSVVAESADDFLRRSLSETAPTAHVVFHSIVWQYLAPDVRDGVREALRAAGSRASSTTPVVWARMEPAGPVADVRVTLLDGSSETETIIGEVGYHGQDFVWRVDLG